MIKRPSAQGYYLDLFFIQKPMALIDQKLLLSCIQSGLYHCGLRIENVVSKKEFSEKTRSVKVNRYVRVPPWFLQRYDERVFKKTSLEVITYDPRHELKDGGIKLQENVHFENAFFHDSRYLSVHLIDFRDDTGANNYTIVKVSYNFKLKNAFPSIVDITAYTGMYLTSVFNCQGVYTRAGSFARSEEIAISFYQGREMSKIEGADTCFNFIHEKSRVEETYGINCRKVMDLVDTYMTVLYSPDDLIEVEDMRRHHLQKYNLDRPEIYKKLDAIMNDWIKRTAGWTDYEKKVRPIKQIVRQMLEKDGDTSSLMVEPEQTGITQKKADEASMMSLERVVDDISELLISHVTIKENLYKEVPVVDIYFRVNRVPSSVSS